MRPMRPAPNTATFMVPWVLSVIVSSSVFGFFNFEFEPVGQRDEKRLTQADRACQRAKCKRAAFLHKQLRARIPCERRQAAIGNDERLRLVMMRDAQAILRFAAIGFEADGDDDVALFHAAD